MTELQIVEVIVLGTFALLFSGLAWKAMSIIQSVNEKYSHSTEKTLRDILQSQQQLVDHLRSTKPEETIWYHTQERVKRIQEDRKEGQTSRMVEAISKQEVEPMPKETDDFYQE